MEGQGSYVDDLSWLPPCVEMVKMEKDYVSVIIRSEEQLKTLLENHKRVTLTTFITWSGQSKNAEKLRLLWRVEDYCDNTPLCVTKRAILVCQHGKAKSRRSAAAKESLEQVHTKKRFHAPKGTKVDCPAKLFIRHVKRYDTFCIEGEAGKTKKEDTMKRLKAELVQANPPTSTFIHVKVPLVSAHQNHTVDIGCCRSRQQQDLVKEEGTREDLDAQAAKDNMAKRIRTAQREFREELERLCEDSYLCEDLETLTRSTEALLDLRASFVPQCQSENGILLKIVD